MKEFKVSLKTPIILFQVMFLFFIGKMFYDGEIQGAIVTLVFEAVIVLYVLIRRPYKYTIDRKNLIIHKHLGKPREINLMTCETISDPIPKLTRLNTNPHGIEIYTEGKKRIPLSPKDRLEFVQAVVIANKRIHVQVEEFAKNHRAFKKQQKKQRKKEMKQDSKA